MKKEFKLFLKEITDLKERDLDDLITLFFETVHTVNKEDYDQIQLNVWAPKNIDSEKWRKRISNNYLFVARDERIVGFGELSPDGCISMLYVHKDYLRRGIGKELLDLMVEKARELNILEIFTEASITSKPFFESQGFKIVKKQVKTFNNVNFINYQMKKTII
ncbi:MAG TPA: GNAT family N-acetyltransferase [Methanobacterium sp.]|nr:GNAT family N-acetyltransferase [Methanobacterium sp.]